MAEREPGAVAIVWGHRETIAEGKRAIWQGNQWALENRLYFGDFQVNARPLVVIDPSDSDAIERLAVLVWNGADGNDGDPWEDQDSETRTGFIEDFTHGLREYANPKPQEPTDPKACVTDRRENVWRLLADGEWVCTSGPDIGEYVTWDHLAAERGPLEVTQ